MLCLVVCDVFVMVFDGCFNGCLCVCVVFFMVLIVRRWCLSVSLMFWGGYAFYTCVACVVWLFGVFLCVIDVCGGWWWCVMVFLTVC